MKRPYNRELYTDRVSKIKDVMRDCCIGVGVIVCFPVETDDHFFDTYNYFNELNIPYLHVFIYSEKENTLAANM
ncbi:MAG: threonylcarbamoyladenosine tRNA methylthiotransferase MtaB [Nonlabens sp.]|jgi:threonylcarbamoyladenosine tRNA methylthiotransferase MtaB